LKTSDLGKSFIKSWESLSLNAYQDPIGLWTIGYGHVRHVNPIDIISEERANELLEEDLIPGEGCLNFHFKELNQNQFDALSSFIFNLGVNTFLKSSIFKFLEAKRLELAARYIKFYNKARNNGELIELPGLTKRRNSEFIMFTDGSYLNNE
jgi:GH24 family phage-related lysozyme (muramidase)